MYILSMEITHILVYKLLIGPFKELQIIDFRKCMALIIKLGRFINCAEKLFSLDDNFIVGAYSGIFIRTTLFFALLLSQEKHK